MNDESEPTPYEFAALERECDESPIYRQRVAAAAIRITAFKTRLSMHKLGEKLDVQKNSLYRIINGVGKRGMGRIEFDGIIFNLERVIGKD